MALTSTFHGAVLTYAREVSYERGTLLRTEHD